MTEDEKVKITMRYGKMFDYDYFPNEPASVLTEEEIIELYKKCIREGKPWQHYYKPEDDAGKIR